MDSGLILVDNDSNNDKITNATVVVLRKNLN